MCHALDVRSRLRVAELGCARQPGDGLSFAVHDRRRRLAHFGGEYLGTLLSGEMGLAQFEHVAHPGAELMAVDRFRQEVVCAQIQRLVTHFALVAGSDHEDRQAVPVAVSPYPAQKLQPIHLRHHVVEDDQVWLIALAPRKRIARRFERERASPPEPVDERTHQGEVEWRVVEHDDLHRSFGQSFHARKYFLCGRACRGTIPRLPV